MANYNSTAASDGFGIITIPSNLQWVGLFILTGDYPTFSEVANFDPWAGDVYFKPDAISEGFTMIIQYPDASITDQIERGFLYQISIIVGNAAISAAWKNSSDYALVALKKVGEKNILMERIKCTDSTP